MKIKAFLALLLSVCILLPVLAQTNARPPPPQKPTDDQDDVVKITTNLVQVDAVVTKDGKMVTNLTADDFEIYEDGRKQAITSFAYVSNVPNTIASQPVPRDKNNTDGPPVAPINPNEPHRTVAFVIDDLGMSAESMGLVRHQLKKFIAEQLQPNDLVAIIRTGGELGALQQFTNDKRLLSRAVERLRWNHCSRVGPTVFLPAGSEFNIRRMRAALALTGQLDGPCGLSSMVWLSCRVASRWSLCPTIFHARLRNQTLPEILLVTCLAVVRLAIARWTAFGNTRDWSGMLQRIAEKAIRSSVVIYSVDTAGLQYTGPTGCRLFPRRCSPDNEIHN